LVINEKPEESPYGVAFSQLHAVEMADFDGDGLLDVLTGKRHYAHGSKGDPEPLAAPVLYWFKLVRDENGASFIPHKIDDDSGVGTQVTVGDLNGDKRPDVIVGCKRGQFVFLQEAKPATEEEWKAAQPKRTTASR
ncbi:MAG: FG-GAP repeat domain-containing protein, partial [Planctomycetia bacterium]